MKEIDFQHDLLPLKHKLYRLAQRITLDPLEAEDVVEDALVKVWERRHSLLELENLEAYCITLCRNLSLDRAAKKDAQNHSLSEMDYEAEDDNDRPDEALERCERIQMVRDCLARLPEKMRTALHLRDIEGYTYQQVAESMQISESDVKVCIHRARQSLKRLLLSLRRQF